MNENHSVITRLMYQLFIALGKKAESTLGQYSVNLWYMHVIYYHDALSTVC